MANELSEVSVCMVGPPHITKAMMDLLRDNYPYTNIRGTEWQTSHPDAQTLLLWLRGTRNTLHRRALPTRNHLQDFLRRVRTRLCNWIPENDLLITELDTIQKNLTSPPVSPDSEPDHPGPTEITKALLSELDTIRGQLSLSSARLAVTLSQLPKTWFRSPNSSSTKPSMAGEPSSSSAPTSRCEAPTEDLAQQIARDRVNDALAPLRDLLLSISTSRTST